MCGVLRSAHHTLTDSSAEYQVLHAQNYKSCVVKRDLNVNKHGMADEPEDAVVVVLGLLLAEKVMETARVWAVCVTARVGGE